MTRRERRVFHELVDAVCAPRPPLPPVEQTDALEAFERWMRAAPAINRAAVRGALLLLGARAIALEPLRAIAALSYYGDARVSEIVGYAPRAV